MDKAQRVERTKALKADWLKAWDHWESLHKAAPAPGMRSREEEAALSYAYDVLAEKRHEYRMADIWTS